MLQEITPRSRNPMFYKSFFSGNGYAELMESARAVSGLRIVHVNATPRGGGVAELLKSQVALEKGAGLNSSWHVLKPDARLFEITKKLHNSLQGAGTPLTVAEKDYYLQFNYRLAEQLKNLHADVVILHDPQPLAAASFLSDPQVISRIHIDMSSPHEDSLAFVLPHLQAAQMCVFTAREFVPEALTGNRIVIVPPAIDPFTSKNIAMSKRDASVICAKLGIDTSRPVLVQVSRFDAWKDPLGVIEAYRLARQAVPGLQLVLAGVIEAQDDPEALQQLALVLAAAENDPDIHLFYDLFQLKNLPLDTFINALQTRADVVMQKSLREGFGLVVSEAMWKAQPVIAGAATGLKLQVVDGETGFIVVSPRQAAEKAVHLLQDPGYKAILGAQAKERVRNNFLITRLLKDSVALLAEVQPVQVVQGL